MTGGVLRVMRDLVVFGLIGATVALLDAVHVYTDTLAYPKNTWFFTTTRQPFWVPLLFGGSGIVLGFAHRFIIGSSFPPVTLPLVVRHAVTFLCCYGASGFLRRYPYVLSILYVLISFRLIYPRWKKLKGGAKERVNALLYYLGVFIGGPLVEATISSTGRFHYEPDSKHLHGLVPVWLPPLYLTVALTVSSLDSFLCGHVVKEKVK